MELLKRLRFCLSFAAAVVVAGCGASSTLPGNSGALVGAMERPPASSPVGDRSDSWMLPEAKDEDLIYASDMIRSKVFVLSLATGALVGEFGFSKIPWGICTDDAGHIFVTRSTNDRKHGEVSEYTHGGTTPIAQLNVEGGANACAIDPANGDLAVSAAQGSSNVKVSIYAPPFTGRPLRSAIVSTMGGSVYLTYDNKSNLYFSTISYSDGSRLFKLSRSGGMPFNIAISPPRDAAGSAAGWVGHDLIFAAGGGDNTVERIRINGKSGRVANVTTLEGAGLDFGDNQFATNGSVIVAGFAENNIGVWAYPDGKQLATFSGFGGRFVEGIAISRASGSSRRAF